MTSISPDELARLLESPAEFALFDVREAGEADRGQVFGASFLPRRLLELRIADLVANRAATIVLCDEGGARASRAAEALERVGYRDVRVLQGGTAGWEASGRKLMQGSNVPSKLFGEEIYEHQAVPQLQVDVLKGWQERGEPHVVCDIRTPDEYDAARIPGAYGAFGVDLALVAKDLRDKGVPVVVHCAGRTRSIIACQTLREFGVERACALENGTMGWQVAGYELERGTPRGVLEPSRASAEFGEARARQLALGAGATEIGPAELERWLAERAAGTATTYAFDVRQVDAYRAGHVPGAVALPGGLAIQRTDEFAPVRAARVVFVDERGARAHLTAYWFRRFGRPQVHVLAGGVEAWQASGRALEPGRSRSAPLGLRDARARTRFVAPAALAPAVRDAVIVDVDTSRHFRNARLHGAHWIAYGSLENRIGALCPAKDARVVLTCHDGVLSTYAAANLARLGYSGVQVLEGGTAAWCKAALPVDSGWPDGLAPAQDLVVPPYHSNRAAMAAYLDWEQKLTAGRRAAGAAH